MGRRYIVGASGFVTKVYFCIICRVIYFSRVPTLNYYSQSIRDNTKTEVKTNSAVRVSTMPSGISINHLLYYTCCSNNVVLLFSYFITAIVKRKRKKWRKYSSICFQQSTLSHVYCTLYAVQRIHVQITFDEFEKSVYL